ncbi:MAG: bacterioferritin [Proteobacteria bacterium]|nr:bacterioferritin [Pseudomonadota bacterium]
MKGDSEVIRVLNQMLTGELTAINQYFLHARILQDRGYEKLGQIEYKASIDEMKHADMIIQRILFLEGHPNLQVLGKLKIGKNIKEILEGDLSLEHDAVKRLKEGITVSENKADYVTRDLFIAILESEEKHIDWLETQLNLIRDAGLENYTQSQIMMDETYKED